MQTKATERRAVRESAYQVTKYQSDTVIDLC